ncbi:hypothetical protein IGI98_002888 [Enterococcus sp. DIV0206e]
MLPIIPEEKRVYHMDELQKRKVIEHNDLITSVAKMDKVPLKIFELAVSCIDTDNPPKDNVVYLSKKELFSFFDVSDNDKHSRFKKAVEKMQKQAYFQVREDTKKGFEFESIVPIPTVKWNNFNDEVFIRFNPDIMPYLIDMKTNFTQYAIIDIMELSSKYSIILYKWLCMFYNQFEHYQFKGNRTKKQLSEYKNPKITVKDLRELTDTVNEYTRSDNFEMRVLKQPIEEINSNTHFNVKYEKIKKGRSIDSIQFYIEKKAVVPNSFYKQEQNDPAYLQSKEQKEQEKEKLYTMAMQSKFTKILIRNLLISPLEMTDIDLMANIQKKVYPLYEQLQELRGLNGVKEHLSYVAAKQEGYSKSNIVKYLFTSIETYLVTVKLQNLN